MNQDETISISNPRLLTAIYFSLLALIATIAIDTLLRALGFEQIPPLFKTLLLSVIVAAAFGALFGKRIVHSNEPYRIRVFWWAFLMVILALPVYTLGLVSLLRDQNIMLTNASWQQLTHLYLSILGYGFILAGIWLAILAGIAAIYLRSHLVNYLLHSLYTRRKNLTKNR